MTRRCIAILGGSFDPVHQGHVELGAYFAKLLAPDELRIIPAGNPWQKQGLIASGADRVEMVRRAFQDQTVPVVIDQQEIERAQNSGQATYTIDTLRSVRAECGPETSIVCVLGSDQLLRLDTWRDWQQLFDYAHVCVASRPGFKLDMSAMPQVVSKEFARRAGTASQIRNSAHGLTYLAADLAIDISATEIRTALQRGEQPEALIPHVVLDYIQQQHLYKS